MKNIRGQLGPSTHETPPLSVSELNSMVKQCLDQQFMYVYIEGETSNVAKPSSGHVYFTLKDEQAQIRCVCFKSYKPHHFELKNGQKVVVKGKVTLYQPRGDYQLNVFSIEESGVGALLVAYHALKKKLTQEGLFNSAYKKPLPTYPSSIGIVTAPQGAALQDVQTTLQRRFPLANVQLYPTMVQGQEALPYLMQAIHEADIANHDVIILCRGGGSIEDLWVFNEEQLVRKIFDCQTPVVAGIGHETDFTLADEVADSRAPTPTAAAELCTPNTDDIKQYLDTLYQKICLQFKNVIASNRNQLNQIQKNLLHPKDRLHDLSKRLSANTLKLHHFTKNIIFKHQKSVTELKHKVDKNHPKNTINLHQTYLNTIQERLSSKINYMISSKKQKFSFQVGLLDSLSPLATLNRGFSISKQGQKIVKSVSDVNFKQPIQIQVVDGIIETHPVRVVEKTDSQD